MKELLEREGVACELVMRSDNYLYGPGILNDGLPLIAGRYAIQVRPEDEEHSLELIEGGQSPMTEELAAETPQRSGEAPEAEKVSVARPARLLEAIVFVAIFLAALFAIIDNYIRNAT